MYAYDKVFFNTNITIIQGLIHPEIRNGRTDMCRSLVIKGNLNRMPIPTAITRVVSICLDELLFRPPSVHAVDRSSTRIVKIFAFIGRSFVQWQK